ncbi:MAG: prepilin-type N-terminal cleavage/methylation domain-containing protein [Candidatus Omnitrophica bacterium]|nr:prepilin-type N-terminal cleavage/methylation domain-containing protein [Candidatus Omnitrophota bacterium]
MGRKKSGQSGVSMMEIMIALVVAAALSAIAAPNWQKSVDKKRADRALAALMTISECIKQYKVEYRLGTNPNITYGDLEAFGCVSRFDYPPGFNFPASTSLIPNAGPVAVRSSDGSRWVCVTDIGNLSAPASTFFIDYPDGGNCTAAYTGYYRRIREDEIGKQLGY